MHKILVIRLYFPLDALHFRIILVHLQEQLYKLYIAFGICRYMPDVCLLCGYSHTTARLMVSAYTKCDVQLINLLLKMD